MNQFPAGTDVTVTIPFVDRNGAALPAAGMALSYTVLDELENVVQTSTDLPAPQTSDTGVTVTIPRTANQLAGPAPNISDGVATGNPIITVDGLREIQLTMTTAAGQFVTKIQYLLKASDAALVLLQNSFQTYNLSLLTASRLVNLQSWPDAAEGDRINALIQAWLRMTKLGYFVRWPRDPDAQNYLNWFDSRNEIIIPRLWTVMTTQRWYNYYPENFRQAMRDAQVLDADFLLTNDVYQQRRDAGIIRERVGESDIQFRNVKPLNLGLSKAALARLQGYVDTKYTITRS